MKFSIPKKAAGAAFGIAAALHLAALPMTYAAPAAAASTITLPSPYISRSLDAVLIPIDDTTRVAFGLGSKENGVLVLAVEPGGVADKYGIEPGDVISQVKGHKIKSPIDLDQVVYYWIKTGAFDFVFNYWRGGEVHNIDSYISLELYETAVDISTVSTWESTTIESWSYAEYYEEYSEEITTTYEESETTIEETVTSEEYSEEITEEATSEDGDFDEDGVADSEDTDDDGDGITDDQDQDDDGDGIADDAQTTDTDGDGEMDAYDSDDDGDGTADEVTDEDGDGVNDADDVDEGNDGSDDAGDDGSDDAGDEGGDDAGGDDGE